MMKFLPPFDLQGEFQLHKYVAKIDHYMYICIKSWHYKACKLICVTSIAHTHSYIMLCQLKLSLCCESSSELEL